jgi:hypothetical protein
MKGGAEFLWKSVNRIMEQTFKDYEIVIVKEGKMAENTNAGIKRARGELIKILYLDDCLAHPNALQEIVDAFDKNPDKSWLITGVNNNLTPYWTADIETGNNKLGSPSALTIRNNDPLLFDETMSWLLDCDYYKRMYARHGAPMILRGVHVEICEGDHQMTRILTQEQKRIEHDYLSKKYS